VSADKKSSAEDKAAAKAKLIEAGLPTPDGAGVYSISTEVSDAGPVYAAMTAYDITDLESGYSNEADKLIIE